MGKPKQEKALQNERQNHKNTKDRKGGKKVRKVLPQRRINDAVGWFEGVSETVKEDREARVIQHKEAVAIDPSKIVDEQGYRKLLQGTKRRPPNVDKLRRLLMPNARFG